MDKALLLELIVYIIIAVVAIVILLLVRFKIISARNANKILRRVVGIISDRPDLPDVRIKMTHIKYETIVTEFNENKITNLSIKYYGDFLKLLLTSPIAEEEPFLSGLLEAAWHTVSKHTNLIYKNRDLLIVILDAYTDLI